MKTLDEVIDAMERCSIPHYFDCKGCPYEDDDAEVGCRSDDRDADALHYLKEYLDKAHRLDIDIAEHHRSFEQLGVEIARYQEAIKNCEEAENKYRQLSGTSQKLRNTSQITCPKCHSEFVILDDPDGDHQQLEKCRALLQDFYRNDPLSWDELKGMEGKPVWVEPACEWILISCVEDDRMYFIEKTCNEYSFFKEEMGRWQAYRKERE